MNQYNGTEIAIIGMSGRFPGARNISEFWNNLKKGQEAISFFRDEELIEAGVEPETLRDPKYVKAYGWLEGAEDFDHTFFQYNEKEALMMDPQMRVLHEIVWEALEDAGYNPDTYDKRIGLFAGASDHLYWQVLSTLSQASSTSEQFETSVLNNKDFLATQIAYKTNLRGPAVTVSSACSTSLTSIHLAGQSLLTGECEIALAGGVTISLPAKKGYFYQEGMILSPDGHCRPFDEAGTGIVGGNGGGIIVLKMLEDALRDGDHIYAIIKGSAINNDGSRKVGYTAPSINGQVDVIRFAHQIAEVESETITYLEAHGTGTKLGDPVEVEALKQAFRTTEKNFCAIGSVKSNIGHLDAAAGVAGLIKTVLMLKHKEIPPTINLLQPNEAIDFNNSPFYLSTSLQSWKVDGIPRRAGITSLGIGGTNAHIVLEEAPSLDETTASGDVQIIPLSAQTPEQLNKVIGNLLGFLEQNPSSNLDDIAFTLQQGRKHMAVRKIFVSKGKADLLSQLSLEFESSKKSGHTVKSDDTSVIMMFPGQGSQYRNMGAGLISSDEVFRNELQTCLNILKKYSQLDFYSSWFEVQGTSHHKDASIRDTALVQPFLFAFEYALAKSLRMRGLKVDAMIGHSLGEYVAACLSGVFSLEDALCLVVKRGELMNRMPSGAMLSIVGSTEEIVPFLDQGCCIAAVNSDRRVVVSGGTLEIEQLEERLSAINIICKRLYTSHAFHSEMTESILEDFHQVLSKVVLNPPLIPFVSNLTGTWITNEQAVSPSYWCQQMRNPVLFRDDLTTLLQQQGRALFLEIGPGNVLSSFLHEHREKQADHHAVNLIRHVNDTIADDVYFANSIGKAWSLGLHLNWFSFFASNIRKRISLPSYPFEKQTFSLRGDPYQLLSSSQATIASDTLAKQAEERWIYSPIWKSSPVSSCKTPLPLKGEDQHCYLVFLHYNRSGESLRQWIGDMEKQAVFIYPGETFQAIDENTYRINPEQTKDYAEVFRRTAHIRFTRILHSWSISEKIESLTFHQQQTNGLYSILNLARGNESAQDAANMLLTIVSNQIHQVQDEEIVPEKATMLGAVKVISQENPLLQWQHIDVQIPEENDTKWKLLWQQIWMEMDGGPDDKIVAYRGKKRWIQSYEQVRLQQLDNIKPALRQRGVYFITGGLGKIGLLLAEHLAMSYQAKVALLTRSDFPEKSDWGNWIASHKDDDQTSQLIHHLRHIEAGGGQVMVCQANVSDIQRLSLVIERIEQEWGTIHGVIHAAADTTGRSSQSVHQELEAEDFARQFQSKVFGTKVIDQIFNGKPLDFCLLFSSLASVLGGLGFAAYAAANQFMDAYAIQKRSESEVPWISINWDSWDFEDQTFKNEGYQTSNQRSILPEEGIKVFEFLTSWPEAQAVVSTYDLNTLLNQWLLLKGIQNTGSAENVDSGDSHMKRLEAVEGNAISIIASIWKDQLGRKEIDQDDSFFDLGGDSLKALSIIAQIQNKLKRKIELRTFYEHPTIFGLARILDDQTKNTLFRIPAAEMKAYYPLTSSQERLFILSRMHPDSMSYNLPSAMWIEGDLDVAKMEGCFQKLINRHEALRASFHMVQGQIRQRIHESIEVKFTFRNIGEDQWQRAVTDFIQPFSLEEPGLIRICVFKLAEEKFLLAIDMHHIIADGVSFKILWEETVTLYQEDELPVQSLRYRDYCTWEKSEAAQALLEQQKAFWIEQLQDIPKLTLPTDYRVKETLQYLGNTIPVEWDEKLSRQINDFVKENRVTKFVFFLSAFHILLAKLSGQEDIIAGTPIAGRNHPELENIFGHFLNILPLRSYPNGRKTFREYLQEVSNQTIHAFENQNFTYKSMVETLPVKWEANQNPLFDVMIIMQNIENKQLQLPALSIKSYPLISKATKFMITLEIFEYDQKFSFNMEYCTELFKEQTIQNFMNYYKKIVQYILDHRDCLLSEIKLSSAQFIGQTAQDLIENSGSLWD